MKRMTERYKGCGKIPGFIGGPVLDRLCDIEDALGDEYDLERVKELAQADREGRVKILEKYKGEVCGTCEHYKQVPEKNTERATLGNGPGIDGAGNGPQAGGLCRTGQR